MIGARHTTEDTFDIWKQSLQQTNQTDASLSGGKLRRRINMINHNQNNPIIKRSTNGKNQFLCRKTKWLGHRLFAVYQTSATDEEWFGV